MKTASLHITKDILEDLYINQGLTIRECAECLGMPTHGSISGYLKKFGIKTRPGGGDFLRGNPINKGTQHFLGRKHTKEARKKMSESAKVKVFTDEHRANISKANKGRKQSKEWVEKRMIAHVGHTRSCGHKNPNWKGGIMHEPYCGVWGDKEYKWDIKKRDSFRCQNPDCWGTSDILCIHHIDYDKKHCHPDNLITVCHSCNIRANYQRRWHKSWYNAIMQRSGKTINNNRLNI